MKIVSEIFKLTRNYVRDRICRCLCSEYVNLFARRQHLFDIAAKPINVDSNFLSYPALLLMLKFRPKRNHLICSHSNYFIEILFT